MVLLVLALHIREGHPSVVDSLEVSADASKAIDRRSVSNGAIMSGDTCVCWFSRT